jgi:hypothetical protein
MLTVSFKSQTIRCFAVINLVERVVVLQYTLVARLLPVNGHRFRTLILYSCVFEMLWVQLAQGNAMTVIGVLYHPPAPIYQTSDLLDHIEAAVLRIQQDFPLSRVILAGDLNSLPDSEVIIRTGVNSSVTQPTRGNKRLDRVYASDVQYSDVRVIRSAVK